MQRHVQNVQAALFIIAAKWIQTRYTPIGELINKLWYIHTMEYYSARKRSKLLITQYNMNESQNNYAELKKSQDKKEYTLYNPLYRKC